MLSNIREIVTEWYYDPQFHGIDLNRRVKAAKEQIKRLNWNSQIFGVIAQVLLDFNDSHTLFLPPSRENRTEYGFSLQMIGNTCHVVEVKPGSDAEAQGVKAGDVVLSVDDLSPTRSTLWKVEYLLYSLQPQEKLSLTLKGADGEMRTLSVRSRIVTFEERLREFERREGMEKHQPELRFAPYKCHEVSADLTACKLYSFDVASGAVDKMMKEVAGHRRLILDLRGNSGGYIATEAHLTGYFFDHNVKMGSEVGRHRTKDRIAKSRKKGTFSGELVVLVDSRSASGSEILARVVQIEKRGEVIGDVTAGMVRASRYFGLAAVRGVESEPAFAFYGVNVTVGDFVMSDGQRLEGKGVIPDILIWPTERDLGEKSDPALAYAATLFGARLSAEDAGKFRFNAPVPEPRAGNQSLF